MEPLVDDILEGGVLVGFTCSTPDVEDGSFTIATPAGVVECYWSENGIHLERGGVMYDTSTYSNDAIRLGAALTWVHDSWEILVQMPGMTHTVTHDDVHDWDDEWFEWSGWWIIPPATVINDRSDQRWDAVRCCGEWQGGTVVYLRGWWPGPDSINFYWANCLHCGRVLPVARNVDQYTWA